MHKLRVLIAEDMAHERLVIEAGLRKALPDNVRPDFSFVDHAEAAVQLVGTGSFDLVVLDIDFSRSPDSRGMSGLEAAKIIRFKCPDLYVVVVSSDEEETTMRAAVEKFGVDWYLRRSSLSFDELAWLSRQSLVARLHREGLLVGERYRYLTENGAAKRVLRQVDAIHSQFNTLIYGETGTGKELIARRIHANAKAFDPKRPLRILDCSAISPTLFEGEVFGYKKGAFTGAVESKEGILQQANGGDLFLDEIHNIPLNLQQKLLRVLNDGVYSPLGSNELLHSKFRIITATNIPVEQAIREGKLLPDFVERIRKIRLELPPLRARPEDVPLLAKTMVESLGLVDKEFSSEAIEFMKSLSWPGNIRELKGFVDTLTSEVKIPIIGRSHVEELVEKHQCKSAPMASEPIPEDHFGVMAERLLAGDQAIPGALAKLERAYYTRALQRFETLDQVARQNGVSRTTLYRKLREIRRCSTFETSMFQL
jgi:DNA-binding NtrC family response regulator